MGTTAAISTVQSRHSARITRVPSALAMLGRSDEHSIGVPEAGPWGGEVDGVTQRFVVQTETRAG